MKLSSQLVGAFGLLSATALANPFPQSMCGDPFNQCPEPEYRNIKSKPKDQPARAVSGRTIKGCASGCELSMEQSWSVTTEISVGLDLGLDFKAASVGIGASVSYSTTTGEAFTQTIGCPAGATCQLLVTNHMIEVTGNKVWTNKAGCACPEKSPPYTVLLPEIVKTEEGDSARVTYEGCFWIAPPGPVDGYSFRTCPGSPAEQAVNGAKAIATKILPHLPGAPTPKAPGSLVVPLPGIPIPKKSPRAILLEA